MPNPTEAQITEMMHVVWNAKGEEPQMVAHPERGPVSIDSPEGKEYMRGLFMACMPHEVNL